MCDEAQALLLIRVALLCTQDTPTDRPNMPRVVSMLTGDMPTLEVPIKPGFLAIGSGSGHSSRATSSTNLVAIDIWNWTVTLQWSRWWMHHPISGRNAVKLAHNGCRRKKYAKHLALEIVAACSAFVHVTFLQVIFVRAWSWIVAPWTPVFQNSMSLDANSH